MSIESSLPSSIIIAEKAGDGAVIGHELSDEESMFFSVQEHIQEHRTMPRHESAGVVKPDSKKVQDVLMRLQKTTGDSSFDEEHGGSTSSAPSSAGNQKVQPAPNAQMRPPEEAEMGKGETASLAVQDGENNLPGSDGDTTKWSKLTEDVYSLIYTTHWCSRAFLFCVIISGIQMTFLALALWDLLDHYNREKNYLNVPPNVSVQVRVAAALALLMAVATQQDMITAVLLVHEGYHERVLDIFPYATRNKWLLSILSQFVAGFGLLLTSFVLIMQSSMVIELLLRFLALGFISEIDDVAFSLAKNGFVSTELEEEAKRVCELEVPTNPPRFSKRLRRILLLVIYAGLMAGFGIITYKQNHGKFLCQSVYLQFGEGLEEAASLLSGVYTQTKDSQDGRVTYVDKQTNGSNFRLAYCADRHAWTISLTNFDHYRLWSNFSSYYFSYIYGYKMDKENIDDLIKWKSNPCDYWVAKSSETESFDVVTTSDSPWMVGYRTRADPLKTFVLKCVDCESGKEKKETCSGNGQCVKGKCECNDKSHGDNCEFGPPCDKIVRDKRTQYQEDEYPRDVFDEYKLLRCDDNSSSAMKYGRPVYVDNDEKDYIMFNGRRWVIGSRWVIGNCIGCDCIPKITDLWGSFVSDPMDYGTASNAFTPVGLAWYHVKENALERWYLNLPDLTRDIDAKFLCAKCDELNNACFNGVPCVNGTCNCDDVYGALCEMMKKENSTATGG